MEYPVSYLSVMAHFLSRITSLFSMMSLKLTNSPFLTLLFKVSSSFWACSSNSSSSSSSCSSASQSVPLHCQVGGDITYLHNASAQAVYPAGSCILHGAGAPRSSPAHSRYPVVWIQDAAAREQCEGRVPLRTVSVHISLLCTNMNGIATDIGRRVLWVILGIKPARLGVFPELRT